QKRLRHRLRWRARLGHRRAANISMNEVGDRMRAGGCAMRKLSLWMTLVLVAWPLAASAQTQKKKAAPAGKAKPPAAAPAKPPAPSEPAAVEKEDPPEAPEEEKEDTTAADRPNAPDAETTRDDDAEGVRKAVPHYTKLDYPIEIVERPLTLVAGQAQIAL